MAYRGEVGADGSERAVVARIAEPLQVDVELLTRLAEAGVLPHQEIAIERSRRHRDGVAAGLGDASWTCPRTSRGTSSSGRAEPVLGAAPGPAVSPVGRACPWERPGRSAVIFATALVSRGVRALPRP